MSYEKIIPTISRVGTNVANHRVVRDFVRKMITKYGKDMAIIMISKMIFPSYISILIQIYLSIY